MRRFNLSLDDFTCHPKAGLNFESIEWCNKLIAKYPDIKINLFVPTRYARLGEEPCSFTSHLEWVSKINSLPRKNYVICLHGLYHRRSKVDFSWHSGPNSNNNEWELLSYGQAAVLLNKMEEDFCKFGITYQKVFRPPGWHIGENAVRLLADRDYVIAGDKRYHDKFKNKFDNLKWISYTWDLLGSNVGTGAIYAYGHTSMWNKNFFNEDKYKLVSSLLDKNEYKFEFIK